MRRAFIPCLLLLIACGPFFYQAPPSIGSYPERTAAKRWPDVFKEIAPPDPSLPSGQQLDETCRVLSETLAAMPLAERLVMIDRLLAENRGGEYTSRRANFLYEMRELVEDPALFNAAGDYMKYRSANYNIPAPIPLRIRPWNMDEEEFAKLREAEITEARARIAEKDRLAAEADARLRPYWQVRHGAWLFERGEFTSADKEFSRVFAEYPDHPRGMVAALMVPRCRLEEARALQAMDDGEARHEEISGLLDSAELGFREFIKRHPQGRFTPDAHGWLGAVALDQGELGSAVVHQVKRLEMQPTREITRSVLRECDWIFEKLLESEDAGKIEWLSEEQHFDAKVVARHPDLARLFVHHCIDPAAHISLPMWWDDDNNGGRSTIDFLKRRILRPLPFVQLALESLGSEIAASGGAHDATTLTLLGWVATGQGEHEQALVLLEKADAAGGSDESLQARAIVLQRLGRHAEAAEVFNKLVEAYPASPLLADVPLRKAMSLHHSGNSGKAIQELISLAYPEEASEDEPRPGVQLHSHEEIIQWLDTLVQFAPLDELVKAHEFSGLNLQRQEFLRNAIRMRALQSGAFEMAVKYLSSDEPTSDHSSDWWHVPGLLGNPNMTLADWQVHASPLAVLNVQMAKNPPPSVLARLHLEAAQLWIKGRGCLTLPLFYLSYYAKSEEEKQDLLRRRNALKLGYTSEQIHHELDRRDELTQALEHALKAASSEDPSIAAPALELANECLFRRAEFSLYQKSRAYETNATAVSADIQRQLRERFPQSPEARRAVQYHFGPPVGRWMPGDYNSYNAAAELTAAVLGLTREMEWDVHPQLEAFNLDAVLKAEPRTPLVNIRKALAKASRDFDQLRPHSDPEHQVDIVATIDRIDDLRAAASLPDIRTADFLDYANGRKDALPSAFDSLLDFRKRLEMRSHGNGFELGYRNDTILGWREFLDRYPQSPKAEAASFRLTRLIARQSRGTRRIAAFHFPDAPIPNGYKRLVITRINPANDSDEVLAAIDRHEYLFPSGRYAQDIDLLRAGAFIDAGKYGPALELLDMILSNPAQRDLHVIAALDFADIAQRLLIPEERARVARYIRISPGAMTRLQRVVKGDTFLSRLQPLMPWVEGL